MDAPNAPNPANPNAQDQFCGCGTKSHANQSQGPAVQNPVQGPANQNQAQVPAGQNPTEGPAVLIPVQGPSQVGQNIPVQPPP